MAVPAALEPHSSQSRRAITAALGWRLSRGEVSRWPPVLNGVAQMTTPTRNKRSLDRSAQDCPAFHKTPPAWSSKPDCVYVAEHIPARLGTRARAPRAHQGPTDRPAAQRAQTVVPENLSRNAPTVQPGPPDPSCDVRNSTSYTRHVSIRVWKTPAAILSQGGAGSGDRAPARPQRCGNSRNTVRRP